jgi:hypothetical protein
MQEPGVSSLVSVRMRGPSIELAAQPAATADEEVAAPA